MTLPTSSPPSSSSKLSGPPVRWVICRSSFPDHVLNESYRLSQFIAAAALLRLRPALLASRAGGGPGIGCDRNIMASLSDCVKRTLLLPVSCAARRCGPRAAFAMACRRRSAESAVAALGVGTPKLPGDAGRLMDTGCTARKPAGGWSCVSSGGRTTSLRRGGGTCIA
jgi:hypothetical protein